MTDTQEEIMEKMRVHDEDVSVVTYSELMKKVCLENQDPKLWTNINQTIQLWSDIYATPVTSETILNLFRDSERIVSGKIKLECGLKVRILGAGEIMIGDKTYVAMDIDGFIKSVNRHDGFLNWKQKPQTTYLFANGDTVCISIKNNSDETVKASFFSSSKKEDEKLSKSYSVISSMTGMEKVTSRFDIVGRCRLHPIKAKELTYICHNEQQLKQGIEFSKTDHYGSTMSNRINIADSITPVQESLDTIVMGNLDFVIQNGVDIKTSILPKTELTLKLKLA